MQLAPRIWVGARIFYEKVGFRGIEGAPDEAGKE